MTTPMQIMWIPSWYPTEEAPCVGHFFAEQMQQLHKEYPELQLSVIYPEVRPLKEWSLSKALTYRFQTSSAFENGIATTRWHGWNLYPKMPKQQMRAWVRAAARLFDHSVALYGKPHLLHAQSSLWAGCAAKYLSQRHRIPYLITEHRSLFLEKQLFRAPAESCWSTPFLKEAWEGAAHRLAVGSALQRALETYTRQPVMVAPNSIDLDFFHLPSQRPLPTSFHFVTIAHLIPRKNIFLLLEAFKELLADGSPVYLTIGGDGPEKANIQAFLREHHLEPYVRLLGALDREGVRKALHEAHAFVLPSKNETFGVVYIEAMATGLPVIATRCGGPEDIVAPETGLLVDGDDKKSLVQAMTAIKNAHSAYNSSAIRAFVYTRFGSSAVAKKLMELYDQSLYNKI